MRFHNGGADPPRNGCSAKLLSGVVVFNWDEEMASALPYLYVFEYMSMVFPKCSQLSVRNAKFRLPSWDRWNIPGVISLGRVLIFTNELRG